jgi:diaminopimelate epimerase
MKVEFYKYQGTGNDFVMIDDRANSFPDANVELIERLCDRRFGIGADGLILLRNIEGFDFQMVYFNADGRPSTMCGNGGRCIAAFASFLGIGKDTVSFLAADGPHTAEFVDNQVSLQMKDVEMISPRASAYVLDTGSPHFVLFDSEIEKMNIIKLAKAIRHNAEFNDQGINVNFVQVDDVSHIKVRTYERGVEDETYSCGTGVVASAISYYHKFKPKDESKADAVVNVTTQGGPLQVMFDFDNSQRYVNVRLIGPAVQVFKGEVEI